MTKGKIKEGKIVQVIGPVIDIEFEEGDLPPSITPSSSPMPG